MYRTDRYFKLQKQNHFKKKTKPKFKILLWLDTTLIPMKVEGFSVDFITNQLYTFWFKSYYFYCLFFVDQRGWDNGEQSTKTSILIISCHVPCSTKGICVILGTFHTIWWVKTILTRYSIDDTIKSYLHDLYSYIFIENGMHLKS